MNKLSIIKTLVFIFTAMLFFGSALLFQTITKRNNPQTFSISIEEPTGSEIKQIHTDQQKLYLLITGGGISERIRVLDNTSGSEIFNINLKWSENE